MGNILLSDGTRVTLRPVQPDDALPTQEMHQRLSLVNIFYRYLRPHRPAPEEIEHLCRLNENEGAAFVAVLETRPTRVVGLAYYLLEPQHPDLTTEMAILIEDNFQGLGLGYGLFQLLREKAETQHVQAFKLLLHPNNRQMMRLIQRTGLPFVEKMVHGVREVQLFLEPALVLEPAG
ncbi:MAG: GNAT family N-acetyltransferase [Anaerolineales bacterium]|nr:GNAT family N-acetyltransferase [Anaerolineales bacterium]